MSGRWITPEELSVLAAEETNAHRLWTGRDGWIERFGRDFLISHISETDGRSLADALPGRLEVFDLPYDRIFLRKLVKQPDEDDRPVLLRGEAGATPESVVTERGLRFGVDFAAGYSVGLFCDQRANRAFLEELRPRRVLNCFAYTCAFSVAAARAEAETLSLDLSRRSLDRGRANLALNGFDSGRHRFIADDVFAVLPRLARRGERFDAIILDPPTFSRGARGRVFRVERDLVDLLALAREVATPDARILLSTNAKDIQTRELAGIGREFGMAAHMAPPPSEYPVVAAATTVWLEPRSGS